MSVVVPVHNGPEGEAALAAGIVYARTHECRLIAVLNRPSSTVTNEELDTEIDELSNRLEEADIAFSVHPNTRGGDLSALICDMAQNEKSSLVIVGLSQAPDHGKLFLGSQVQRLILESPCPVLLVRDDQPTPTGP